MLPAFDSWNVEKPHRYVAMFYDNGSLIEFSGNKVENTYEIKKVRKELTKNENRFLFTTWYKIFFSRKISILRQSM